jgi:hypothetical protein
MTKSLFAVLLAANALTGCAHLPGVPAAERVVETKVYHAPKPKVLPAKPESETPSQDPTYVDHGTTNWSFPATPSSGSKAAANTPAYLEIAEVPTKAFRAYPVFDYKDQVVDTKFSPASAKAAWQLTTNRPSIVSKVKVELVDDSGTHTGGFEVDAKDLDLPATAGSSLDLQVPLGNPEFSRFLTQCPDTKKVTLTATLEGPDGNQLTDRSGKVVTLNLPIDVM